MKNKNLILAICVCANLLVSNYASAQWSLTGNATTAPNNVLGTTNATDLNINTNGVTRMFIKANNGFIGIGTVTPGYLLDIQNSGNASMNFKSATGNANILIERGTSANSASVNYRTGGAASWQTGNLNDNNFTINNVGVNPSITILKTNNNVGIGTATPKHKLDVNGNIFLGTQLNGQVFNEIGDALYLGASRKYLANTLGSAIDGSVDWINLMAHPGSAGIMFGTSGPSDADPHTAPNPLMVVRSSGKVGIGTNAPTAKMQVEGSANAANVFQFSNDKDAAKDSTMVMTGKGYVGIGLTNPGKTLDVNGTARLNGHFIFNAANGVINWGNAGHLYFRSNPTQGDETSYIDRMILTNQGFLGINNGGLPSSPLQIDEPYSLATPIMNLRQVTGSWGSPANFNAYRFIQTNYTGPASEFKQFNVGGGGVSIGYSTVPVYASSDALYVNGNVGIKTNTPASALDVAGAIHVTGNQSTHTQGSWLEWNKFGSGGITYLLNNKGLGTGGFIFGEVDAANNYSARFLIDANGNTVVGGISPATGYKLTVDGKIICTELKVQLQPFPDYVFATDYHLKSIDEVEQHINTYNRLPGMPSACEVEENGMSMGEMTGKVVEKVEENTLYIIQLYKENQELKAQLKTIQEKLDKLSR